MYLKSIKYKISNLLLIALLFTGISCKKEKEKLPEDLVENFKNPPNEFKPMPFWHINGELTTTGIKEQMKDAKEKAGFSGISVLPLAPKKNGRPGTTPKFLSKKYLERYQDVLNTAEDLDMQVILYDDNDFPSGMAGGKIGELFPQHTMKRLDKVEKRIEGPSRFKQIIPAGKLVSAVAMNQNTRQLIELSSYIENETLQWQVPKGTWKIMFFVMVKDSYHKAFPVVDYLDTTAVREMIRLTYDVYKENFESYFGNTIKMTFFDDVGFFKHPRTWTGLFNEKFMDLNGFDPKPWYPALWYDIGPETEAIRHAFFNTRAELLAEGFPKLVGEWTKENGLKDTGHPPGNYDPTPIDMNGDIFKFFRHTEIPLTDAIIEYQFGQNGHKLISSAADYYDKPIVSTEIYGAYKEQAFDSLMLYRSAMDLFSRGVNFVVPHGMWYNPDQVYISPLVSSDSEKLAPTLPRYSNFVGRSCMLLQGGKRVANIAVLYPFEELAGWYHFEAPDNPRQGFYVSPETNYQKISGLLTNDIRQDFTFIHPEYFLDNKYKIEQGSVLLNNVTNKQKYDALIITGCKIISLKTLQKVKSYFDQGGLVISTGQLPFKSSELGQDEKIKKLIIEIFNINPEDTQVSEIKINGNSNGGKAIYISEPNEHTLSGAITENVVTDVAFNPTPKLSTNKGKFNYIHKIKDGKNIYFFSNSSDETISTEVTLQGKHYLFNANPHNGDIQEIKNLTHSKFNNQEFTKATLMLKPVSSTFWLSNQ
ncbi:glycosyl hydrolase [Maribacter dokdonensis]|uniref:glycosyl hydrolase n=1 Tax=Maribacter dokdonensis TaxID=320912 RepID=UPI002732EED7|nr:glycosyl hydrolase [Maribacter dokdonensis]MDP2527079.1 glycosyl hydrolase [Maribacter dokdonensis]